MKQLVSILLLSTFAVSQDKYQNADMFSSPKTPIHNHDVCASPVFTDEYIVAMREKMRTQYPEEYQRMLMPRTLNKTYSVGMTEKFWVNVDDGNGGSKQEEITAQLLAKGNNNAIWADVNQISENNNINNDTISIIGHTRAATTGAVTTRNAHPFSYGSIIGAHNGIIDNWESE